jgi:hypothetical protein
VPRNNVDADALSVDLPAGGKMHLLDQEEVELWVQLSQRYQSEFKIKKVNDLGTLGAILMHHLTLFRAQRGLSGLEPKYDEDDIFTGEFQRVKVTQNASAGYTQEIQRASKEIREQEKVLGIDKKSRDAAGDQDIPSYIKRLKAFGREMGLHISRRVHAYEEFVNELRWRVRLEQNGDPEDKQYHDCTPEGILKWARTELDALAEVDKKFADEKQKLVVGKL